MLMGHSICYANLRARQVWAEKEMRNLARLRSAGIRAPQPLQLRAHVLVMEFVGAGGVAAPRLKVRPKCGTLGGLRQHPVACRV